MRKKFKIKYPASYHDEKLAGTTYKPKNKKMVVMNTGGVFFLFSGEDYYPSIQKLSDVLPAYDVEWND